MKKLTKTNKIKESQIIQNAIQNLESGEIIVSSHQHDFVTTSFKDGTTLSCDGGNSYFRRVGDIKTRDIKWKDISLTNSDPITKLKRNLVWGTRGIDGNEPLKYVFLKNCDKNHLKSILKSQNQIKGTIYSKVIKEILKVKK